METNSMRISSQSRRYAKVQNLMHNVNEQNLMAQHRHQKLHKAPGIDKVDKQRYETHVNENIGKLVQEMKRLQYRPLPVRRAYIDKGNGKMRPLGIPAYEDRLVQGAMADILNQVYEPRFLDCSMGFRPNRSAHDTVAYINQVIMCRKVNYVLEADIRGFFDNVNHDWMMKFLANDIDDKNFLRYVKRFLIAGIMESWTRPFLIMFTVPLGFLGMYATLWLTGMSMSMMGLLGGVMMIGIVVNNAILIMDECAALVKSGVTTHKAMLLATQSKFRPIVMTSIASVAGMLPMAFGTGLGSELRSSCGMGVVGGLTVASLLTLYVIPALYFIFVHDTARPRRNIWRRFLLRFGLGRR